MAETGTFTIDTKPDGGPIVRVLVQYELLGHGTCPTCGRHTLAVVAVHQPGGDYTRLWTNCDHCSGAA